MQTKDPIKLRRRVNPTGTVSLYLDIYLKGRRKYEFLNLYLVPETTRKEKERNREVLQLAEAIRAKRVVELQNGRFGFNDKARAEVSVFDCFLEMIESKTRDRSASVAAAWRGTLKLLRGYEKDEALTFGQVTPTWAKGLRDYVERSDLKHNTKATYFSCVKEFFNICRKRGVIVINPFDDVEGFSRVDTQRGYLTPDEVRAVYDTPFDEDCVKRAFLFSCFCGLRHSDIERLRWSDVETVGGFTRITFRQKKTGNLEYLDISPQAVAMMGRRGEPTDKVFPDLHSQAYCGTLIQRLIALAGIKKHITFHCARHTFAIMMLSAGVDIYTLSKLLGHRDLSVTQIYAKVLDKNKREAIGRLPQIL